MVLIHAAVKHVRAPPGDEVDLHGGVAEALVQIRAGRSVPSFPGCSRYAVRPRASPLHRISFARRYRPRRRCCCPAQWMAIRSRCRLHREECPCSPEPTGSWRSSLDLRWARLSICFQVDHITDRRRTSLHQRGFTATHDHRLRHGPDGECCTDVGGLRSLNQHGVKHLCLESHSWKPIAGKSPARGSRNCRCRSPGSRLFVIHSWKDRAVPVALPARRCQSDPSPSLRFFPQIHAGPRRLALMNASSRKLAPRPLPRLRQHLKDIHPPPHLRGLHASFKVDLKRLTFVRTEKNFQRGIQAEPAPHGHPLEA